METQETVIAPKKEVITPQNIGNLITSKMESYELKLSCLQEIKSDSTIPMEQRKNAFLEEIRDIAMDLAEDLTTFTKAKIKLSYSKTSCGFVDEFIFWAKEFRALVSMSWDAESSRVYYG